MAQPERQHPRNGGMWLASMPMAIAILATVVLPRLLMLNVSVIDWDESIYALIGQQWTDGHVPHETVWDHKPIGLYAIFAAFFLAFGDTIWAIRLIPIVFVAATAALLGRLAELQFGPERMLGAVTAGIYGLLTLTNGGLATNTEILINLFIVASVYLIVSGRLDTRESWPAGLAAGASLGLAFQVNYLAGILVVGVAAFYLAWLAPLRAQGGLLRRCMVNGSFLLGGFLLAGIAMHLPVVLWGDLADYFSVKLAYLTGYVGVEDTATGLRRITEALSRYWPFVTLALLVSVAAVWDNGSSRREWDTGGSAADRRVVAWLALFAFAVAAALASGTMYQHFFLFAVPALAMLAAAFLHVVCPAGRVRGFCAAWLVMMSAAAVLSSHDELVRGYRAQLRVLHGQAADSIAAAGEFMARRLRPGETIYVHDGQPILYFMTRTVPPTRFAFPDTHLKDSVAQRLGFTPFEAVQGILAREPRFIVTRPRLPDEELTSASALLYETLEARYRPASAGFVGAPANLYERTESSGTD
jgi:4-amino-4-deoxy-L-arabinose transferase-like glycosyltransferase